MKLLALAGCLLCPLAILGATITADSTSITDVAAAVESAADGDTVIIPAGTSTWSSGLTLDKAITLRGAGIGQTIIRDGIASGYIINCTLVADQTTRITGIEFNDNGASADWRFRISGTSIDGRRIRIDNCKFDSLSGPVFLFYTCLGVVHDNVILGKSGGVPAFLGHVVNTSWGYDADATKWGDGAFAENDNFGTDKFLFIEDNAITNLYSTALTMIDGHSGARYVFRHNLVRKGSMEIHGPEAARGRGGRAYEIYGNTFDSDGSRSSPLYMRGGVGLVFSNSISGWTENATFSLLDNRLIDNLFAPFWGADGRNPWDKNNAGNPFDTGTATSAGTLTVTDSSQSWTVNEWAGYTVRRTSGKSISLLTRSGTTATATATGHGFSSNDYVSIWGAEQQPFNGIFQITVTGDDTFTFTISFVPADTTAAGTILCSKGNNFSLIGSNTGTQLTFASSIYGSSHYLSFAEGDTFEINKVDQSMDQIGVAGGADLGGVDVPDVWSNSQNVSAWYEWENKREGDADVDFSNSFSGGTYSTIIENTHFYNDTEKPGFTPYHYPHPLRGLTRRATATTANVGTINAE